MYGVQSGSDANTSTDNSTSLSLSPMFIKRGPSQPSLKHLYTPLGPLLSQQLSSSCQHFLQNIATFWSIYLNKGGSLSAAGTAIYQNISEPSLQPSNTMTTTSHFLKNKSYIIFLCGKYFWEKQIGFGKSSRGYI